MSSGPSAMTTPDSSCTSRRSAASADSPDSTKPASVENQPGAQRSWRPSRARSSRSRTRTMTAGSVRGKCSLPSAGQRRDQPPALNSVGVPHRGQRTCVRSQLSRATAVTISPASRAESAAPDLPQVRPAGRPPRRGRPRARRSRRRLARRRPGRSGRRRPGRDGGGGETRARRPSDRRTRAAPSHTRRTRDRGSARRSRCHVASDRCSAARSTTPRASIRLPSRYRSESMRVSLASPRVRQSDPRPGTHDTMAGIDLGDPP